MSYEINIIVVNQKNPIHVIPQSEILLQNEIDDIGINRYAEIWPYFSSTPGILYSLVTEINDSYYSAHQICDSDFEAILKDELIEWVSNDTKENLTPFIVKDKYCNEFVNIIQQLLENAPQKRLLFQTRYQGGDEEVILGTIKLSKFKDMLLTKHILFNICYILEMD